MFKSKKTKLIERLHATLEDERTLLKSGNLRELSPLTVKKSALVDDLSARSDLRSEDFDTLKPLMEHNQTLLTSAVRAVRRVSGRRTKTAPLANAYDTYTPEGNRQRIGDTRQSKFERRR